jgi:predicted AAA+ superfamily ATPase
MYLQRSAHHHLQLLLKSFPAVVVTGARQVGKCTFLRNELPEVECVVFDPVLDVENARQDPELFLDNHRTPLLLDEIQYASELLPPLKRRIDSNRSPGQYILTGSQQWGVLKSVTESLAGRVAFLDLEGFSIAEACETPDNKHWLHAWLEDPEEVAGAVIQRSESKYTLFERLWRGWLPETHFLPVEVLPDFHLAYQRTYIERDARLMADVTDWQQFGRFMRLAAALTAQQINHSQLGREMGVTSQTSQRWLDILNATFQWFEVPAYSGNTIKKISNKPKGFIADTGVACWALAISTPAALASHPAWGAIFETAVYAEIRKAIGLLSPPPNVYHWHTYSGAEVDLVLERDGKFFPIEVKGKSRPANKDTSGITAFRKTYPKLAIQRGLVVAPCEKMIPLNELDYSVPWDARLVD